MRKKLYLLAPGSRGDDEILQGDRSYAQLDPCLFRALTVTVG